MRSIGSIHSHWIFALSGQSALRCAARRRITKRRDTWRPIALYWRQKRKGLQSVRAARLTPTPSAVRFVQFHLHFVIRENDRVPRYPMRRLSPVAVSHQTRVVMEHVRTIIQSKMHWTQPRREQSMLKASSLRHAQSNSGTKVQTAPQYLHSARQPIAPTASTWRTVHPQSVKPEQTRLHVHPGKRVDRKDQTFHSVPIHAVEPQLLRLRSLILPPSVQRLSLESNLARPDFQPQKLIWRRAVQPAAKNAGNHQQWNLDAFEEQSHGRALTRKEAAFGTSQSSARVPATPMIQIDSALMDRMADDVIRRLERRARIERARQGR